MSLLIYFLLSALIGSCVIAGWHTVTRGKYEQMPDGRMKYTGMIFKGWSKYWEQYINSIGNPTTYRNTPLQVLCAGIQSALAMTDSLQSDKSISVDIHSHNSALFLSNAQSVVYFTKNWWRFSMNNPQVYYQMLEPVGSNGGRYVTFMKLDKVYKFPEWIRKPISSCIYCYGSVYGTIMWVLLAYTAGQDFTTTQLLALWVPYCLTCSIIAPRIWKGA